MSTLKELNADLEKAKRNFKSSKKGSAKKANAKKKIASLKKKIKAKKAKIRQERKVFRKDEKIQPAHVYAERIAEKFNLVLTDGWRPPNVSYGSPTSWHKKGLAFDFYPKRGYGFWGVLDRAKAWAWAKLNRKFIEILWRVPGHAPGDNPHLHLAFRPGAAKPSKKTY